MAGPIGATLLQILRVVTPSEVFRISNAARQSQKVPLVNLVNQEGGGGLSGGPSSHGGATILPFNSEKKKNARKSPPMSTHFFPLTEKRRLSSPKKPAPGSSSLPFPVPPSHAPSRFSSRYSPFSRSF